MSFKNDTLNLGLIYESIKPAKTVEEIANKYDITSEEVNSALDEGQAIEMEHTTNSSTARQIASHHIYEKLDYYKLLKKYVE